MLAQVEGWAAEFEQLCERISPRFARPEVRRRAAGFLRGLLGEVERKNGWQLAEHAGDTTPDGMQRLLTTARWDADALRDDLRAYVVEHLGDPAGCWWSTRPGSSRRAPSPPGCNASTRAPPGGSRTARSASSWPTPAAGRALVDRELYLPKDWAADADAAPRRTCPEQVGFRDQAAAGPGRCSSGRWTPGCRPGG